MTDLNHVTADEVSRVAAYLPPRERALLAHILHCPACQHRLDALLAHIPCSSSPARRLPAEYAAVLDRLEASLDEATERLAAERAQAEATVAGLLAIPPMARRKCIRGEERFRTLPVAALLLEKTLATASAAPDEAENLALLALYILGQLDPGEVPSVAVGELKVQGWALAARACWRRRDWRAVREALEHAEEVMVTEGYLSKRVGFRRALATTRQLERQMEEVLQATTRALELLLRPLLGDTRAGGQGEREPTANDGPWPRPGRPNPEERPDN